MSNLTAEKAPYGSLDATFKAAGGEAGVLKLVNDFYDAMEQLPRAKHILNMHPDDLDTSRDKLFRFLCGWMGGPKLYQEKYGPISIPRAHAHLTIGPEERDAWLNCMAIALDKQSYEQSLKEYLFEQLSRPANMVMNSDWG